MLCVVLVVQMHFGGKVRFSVKRQHAVSKYTLFLLLLYVVSF